ncbi:MAG: hypothetical protein Q8K67_01675 [Geothrix sp.]|nr:hypothetical protein [Geothrix sp.]
MADGSTETIFLEASSMWHKDVVSAPSLSPRVFEEGLRINYSSGGRVSIGWSPKSGRAIYVTFEGARKTGGKGPRRVVELDVR